jgi:hypothetical protein
MIEKFKNWFQSTNFSLFELAAWVHKIFVEFDARLKKLEDVTFGASLSTKENTKNVSGAKS